MIASDLDQALVKARALARLQRVRLWFWESPDRYQEIALDNSPFKRRELVD